MANAEQHEGDARPKWSSPFASGTPVAPVDAPQGIQGSEHPSHASPTHSTRLSQPSVPGTEQPRVRISTKSRLGTGKFGVASPLVHERLIRGAFFDRHNPHSVAVDAASTMQSVSPASHHRSPRRRGHEDGPGEEDVNSIARSGRGPTTTSSAGPRAASMPPAPFLAPSAMDTLRPGGRQAPPMHPRSTFALPTIPNRPLSRQGPSERATQVCAIAMRSLLQAKAAPHSSGLGVNKLSKCAHENPRLLKVWAYLQAASATQGQTELNLEGCNLLLHDFVALRSVLQNHPTIVSVDLCGNDIDAPRAQALLDILDANRFVVRVAFDEERVEPQWAARIAAALERNTALVADVERRRWIRRQRERFDASVRAFCDFVEGFFASEMDLRAQLVALQDAVRAEVLRRAKAHQAASTRRSRNHRIADYVAERMAYVTSNEAAFRTVLRDQAVGELVSLYIAEEESARSVLCVEDGRDRGRMRGEERCEWVVARRQEKARWQREGVARWAVESEETESRAAIAVDAWQPLPAWRVAADTSRQDAQAREDIRVERERRELQQRRRQEELARERRDREEQQRAVAMGRFRADQRKERERVDGEWAVVRKRLNGDRLAFLRHVEAALAAERAFLSARGSSSTARDSLAALLKEPPDMSLSGAGSDAVRFYFLGSWAPCDLLGGAGIVTRAMAGRWAQELTAHEAAVAKAEDVVAAAYRRLVQETAAYAALSTVEGVTEEERPALEQLRTVLLARLNALVNTPPAPPRVPLPVEAARAEKERIRGGFIEIEADDEAIRAACAAAAAASASAAAAASGSPTNRPHAATTLTTSPHRVGSAGSSAGGRHPSVSVVASPLSPSASTTSAATDPGAALRRLSAIPGVRSALPGVAPGPGPALPALSSIWTDADPSGDMFVSNTSWKADSANGAGATTGLPPVLPLVGPSRKVNVANDRRQRHGKGGGGGGGGGGRTGRDLPEEEDEPRDREQPLTYTAEMLAECGGGRQRLRIEVPDDPSTTQEQVGLAVRSLRYRYIAPLPSDMTFAVRRLKLTVTLLTSSGIVADRDNPGVVRSESVAPFTMVTYINVMLCMPYVWIPRRLHYADYEEGTPAEAFTLFSGVRVGTCPRINPKTGVVENSPQGFAGGTLSISVRFGAPTQDYIALMCNPAVCTVVDPFCSPEVNTAAGPGGASAPTVSSSAPSPFQRVFFTYARENTCIAEVTEGTLYRCGAGQPPVTSLHVKESSSMLASMNPGGGSFAVGGTSAVAPFSSAAPITTLGLAATLGASLPTTELTLRLKGAGACNAFVLRRFLSRLRFANVSKEPVVTQREVLLTLTDANGNVSTSTVFINVFSHEDPAELVFPTPKLSIRRCDPVPDELVKCGERPFIMLAADANIENTDANRFAGGYLKAEIAPKGRAEGDFLHLLCPKVTTRRENLPYIAQFGRRDIVFEGRVVAQIVNGHCMPSGGRIVYTHDLKETVPHLLHIAFTEDGAASFAAAVQILRAIALSCHFNFTDLADRTITFTLQLGNAVKLRPDGEPAKFVLEPTQWAEPSTFDLLVACGPPVLALLSSPFVEVKEGAPPLKLTMFDPRDDSLFGSETFANGYLLVEVVDGFSPGDVLTIRKADDVGTRPKKPAPDTEFIEQLVKEAQVKLRRSDVDCFIRDAAIKEIVVGPYGVVAYACLTAASIYITFGSNVSALKKKDVASMLKAITFATAHATTETSPSLGSTAAAAAAAVAAASNSGELTKMIRVTVRDTHQCPSSSSIFVEVLRTVGVPQVTHLPVVQHRQNLSWSERFLGGLQIASSVDTYIAPAYPDQRWAGGSLTIEVENGAHRGDVLRFMTTAQQQLAAERNALRYVTTPSLNHPKCPRDPVVRIFELDENGDLTIVDHGGDAANRARPRVTFATVSETKGKRDTNNLRFDFHCPDKFAIDASLVRACLNCIVFSCSPLAERVGQRVLVLRLLEGSNPACAKTRVTVDVMRGPITFLTSSGNCEPVMYRGPGKCFPTMQTMLGQEGFVGLEERSNMLAHGQLVFGIVGDVSPGEFVSLSLDKNFYAMKGENSILVGKELLCKFSSAPARDKVTMTFVPQSRCKVKHLMDVFRSLGFYSPLCSGRVDTAVAGAASAAGGVTPNTGNLSSGGAGGSSSGPPSGFEGVLEPSSPRLLLSDDEANSPTAAGEQQASFSDPLSLGRTPLPRLSISDDAMTRPEEATDSPPGIRSPDPNREASPATLKPPSSVQSVAVRKSPSIVSLSQHSREVYLQMEDRCTDPMYISMTIVMS